MKDKIEMILKRRVQDTTAEYLAEEIHALRYQIAREVISEYMEEWKSGNIIHENLDYWLDQQEEK